jgi:hypothetical protein
MDRTSQGYFLALSLLIGVGAAAYISARPELAHVRWDFLGSLIGAAGTIFAGWLAFSAVQEQNRLAQQAKLDAADLHNQEEKRQALIHRQNSAKELNAIRDLLKFFDRILKPFDEVTSDADVIYLHGVERLEQTGGFTAPSITGLPDELRNLVQSAWWPLFGVNESYAKWKAAHPDPSTRGRVDRTTFNASVADAVNEIRSARATVAAEIERLEQSRTSA